MSSKLGRRDLMIAFLIAAAFGPTAVAINHKKIAGVNKLPNIVILYADSAAQLPDGHRHIVGLWFSRCTAPLSDIHVESFRQTLDHLGVFSL